MMRHLIQAHTLQANRMVNKSEDSDVQLTLPKGAEMATNIAAGVETDDLDEKVR